MNKRLLILWVMLLAGVLLVACGGGAAEPATAPEVSEAETAVEEPAAAEPTAEEPMAEAPAGDVIQLQLMGWASSDAENSRLQEMIDNFNAANSDVQLLPMSRSQCASEDARTGYGSYSRTGDRGEISTASRLSPVGMNPR